MSATVAGRTRPPGYPVDLDLRGQPALVVGGGRVARRKVAGLLEAGAVVTVVAPDVVDGLPGAGAIRWHRREYRRGEAASYRVVITATGVPEVDAQVARDARATGIPVNAADDPVNCTFTLPAIVRRGDLQVTVSTGGRSPAFASWLRERIDALLDDSYPDLLDLLAEARDELQASGASTESAGWRRALGGDVPDLVAAGRIAEARALLRAHLAPGGGEA